jgi:hypothetical protein
MGLLVGIVDPPFVDSAMLNHTSMRLRDSRQQSAQSRQHDIP